VRAAVLHSAGEVPAFGDLPDPEAVPGRSVVRVTAAPLVPLDLLRGFALVARAAGLLGQLAEERRQPIGMDVYRVVDRNATYVDPSGPTTSESPA